MTLMLATDLDRTLLPNGKEPYDGSLPLLFDRIKRNGITLVYVTGRNLTLVDEARTIYRLPYPEYLAAEVGTALYRRAGEGMAPIPEWREHILKGNPHWKREAIVSSIDLGETAVLQEGWKQNPFKISYYLADHGKKEAVLKVIHDALSRMDIRTEVIWSIDPLLGNIGLIDILPANATKIAALEFIRRAIGADMEDVIYCGDSGNDLLPLTFGYRAILVKNAPAEVKTEVERLAQEKGVPPPYIAVGEGTRNGNYSSGIVEGLTHFGVLHVPLPDERHVFLS